MAALIRKIHAVVAIKGRMTLFVTYLTGGAVGLWFEKLELGFEKLGLDWGKVGLDWGKG